MIGWLASAAGALTWSVVMLSWTPASTYTDGTPLPLDKTWTLLEQHPQSCEQTTEGSAPSQGYGYPLSFDVGGLATFTQPVGTTYCYVARTAVWSATPNGFAIASEPVKAEKTLDEAPVCRSCHE